MELIAWVQIFTTLSVIATIKELIHSQGGSRTLSIAYGLVAFALMSVAIYLTWFKLN